MTIKSDHWITRMAKERGMIMPFVEKSIRTVDGHGVLSYGVSSYGYDVRLADEFKILSSASGAIADPKKTKESDYIIHRGKTCIIPPHGFCLGRTFERLDIPRDVIAMLIGKSTYERVGISIGVTAAEPEWEGYATLMISNMTPIPARVYAFEGCGQILFLGGDEPCQTSYLDRNGKYQNQNEPTLSRT